MFSASEVQNDDKKKAWDNGGVRERDHSVYMWKLCSQTRCVRAPSLAVRKSIVAVESRASEVHFTLDVPPPPPWQHKASVVRDGCKTFRTTGPSSVTSSQLLLVTEEGPVVRNVLQPSRTTEALCCHGGRDKFLNCFPLLSPQTNSSSIVTGRSGPPLTHVFFSRFYVRIFHVKIILDCGCLLGVGVFFSRGSRMFERCGIFFLRSRMFERCGVWIFTCNFTLENFYV